MGADSGAARHGGLGGSGSVGPADAMPLSPRLNGAKVKPLGEDERGDDSGLTDDAMLTAPASALAGQASPALLSPFKPGGALPPVPGGGLGSSALGGLGEPGGLAPGTLLHSASLAGGMDALMMELPGSTALARPDSMANLHVLPLAAAGLGAPDSRNTSAVLGGPG